MKFSRPSILLALVLCTIVAFAVGRGCAPEMHRSPTEARSDQPSAWYTCSMHPSVRLSDPDASCPSCGMDLIPVDESAGSATAPNQIALSPEAAKRAGVETVPIRRRPAERVLRLTGRIVVDETRLTTVAARAPGRIETLYADFTEMTVRKGDHLMALYSPELIEAQQEWLEAVRRQGAANATGRGEAARTVASAREKLRLLGVTTSQLTQLEETQEVPETIEVYSPVNGFVLKRAVSEGDYVDTGSTLIQMADLDRVWLLLDVYEQDLRWVRYGQAITFELEAWPGAPFDGVVSFVSPSIDDHTRTVRVRASVDNKRGLLKPGMLARAEVRARLKTGGMAMEPTLVGKWISPMHPEIIRNGPGACDICGMDLVPAETLGWTADESAQPPLVIPDTAPLLTGRRAVVFVRIPDQQGVFEARNVVLGPRAGDVYVVEKGLREGEEVVVRGAFKIDSEIQLRGGPSMMAATSHETETTPLAFREAFGAWVAAGLDLQVALAADDLPGARSAVEALAGAVEVDPGGSLTGSTAVQWSMAREAVRTAVERLQGSAGLTELRAGFEPFSNHLRDAVRDFGVLLDRSVRLAFCPMAFDNRGAEWLQAGEVVANPYFGSEMPRCGTLRATLHDPAAVPPSTALPMQHHH